MKLNRLNSLPAHGVGFDTETYLIRTGNLVPKPVCASISWLVDGILEGRLLTRDEGLELFQEFLDSEDMILVGANVAYDIAVIAHEFARRNIDVMPGIFRAFEQDRVFDIQLAEALNAIAMGHLGTDPRTGDRLKDPVTKKPGRYSLSICTHQVLGRVDAKENDEYRLRYGELDAIPMSDWPEVAKTYPVDDARNTYEVGLAQAGHVPKLSPHHEWNMDGTCADCGASDAGVDCLVTRPHFNLHEVGNRTYTAFCLHLGAIWGFKVNQKSVDIIEEYAQRTRAKGEVPFREAGLIRPDGTEDRSKVKKLVAEAYGSTEICPVCKGTGKVPSAKNPKSQIICFELSANGEKLKTCDGTGYVIHPDVPRSEKEGISYGRDTLSEAGMEILMDYASEQEGRKTLDVYVPYLRTARDENGRDVPLTLRPNAVLDTGRVSYDGVIQLFPRAIGFTDKSTGIYIPSLRECIVARPGRMFSSEDFKAGELFTHAQSGIWICGHSDLAQALLRDVDPHLALAATVLGISYDEAVRRKKEPKVKKARQAAKPFTFGKPGGMGSVKLVHQQRKQGPDTPCEGGPSMVDDGTGTNTKVPGYKGLRFCILMNGAQACGVDKVTQWGKKGREQKIAPTCAECLRCADSLGGVWYEQWSENRAYFNYIQKCVEDGMLITDVMLERWPHLQEIYSPNTQLQPGQIMQHVSGRLRGGLEFSACANGFFQGLLGDISTSALRRAVRECYDKTYRIPTQQYENTRPSRHGGGKSPLYGSRIIGFFHDELFAEHPESAASDAAWRISDIMYEEMAHYCPDVAAACGAEPTLMPRWLKQAEKIEVNGRLVPWEPNQ